MTITVLDFTENKLMSEIPNTYSLEITPSACRKGVLSNKLVLRVFNNKKFILFLHGQKKIIFMEKNELNRMISDKKIPQALFDLGLFVEENLSPTAEIEKTLNRIRKFNTLYISLTSTCNLSCNYCYASHSKEKSNYRMIKDCFDYLKCNDYSPVRLIFLSGGEHTLEFGLMQKAVSYAKKKFPNISIVLTTNGVFPSSYCTWIEKNIDDLSISCDGPPFIQDAMRSLASEESSSPYVQNSILRFVADRYLFAVKCLVTPSTIGNESRIIEYFKKLGVKRLLFSIYGKIGKASHDAQLSGFNDFPALYRSFKKLCMLAMDAGIDAPWTKESFFKRHIRICGAQGNYFVLSAGGIVSLCSCFSDSSDQFEPRYSRLILGAYNKSSHKFELNMNIIDQNKNALYAYSKCLACDLKFYCMSLCTRINCMVNGNPLKIDEVTCMKIRRKIDDWIKYQIEKNVIKKYPFIRKKNNGYCLVLSYEELPLAYHKNTAGKESAQFIYINTVYALQQLQKKILSSVQKSDYLIHFYLHVNIPDIQWQFSSGEKLIAFFSSLKQNKIIFEFAAPLPSCIFSDAENVNKTYSIPKTIEESLCFFTVSSDGALFFVNGGKGKKKFIDYESRGQIASEFNKLFRIKLKNKCKQCVLRARGHCQGVYDKNQLIINDVDNQPG